MNVASALFVWFYRGLGGLGGWAVFAGGGLIAAAWVVADSRRRSLPARADRQKILAAQLLYLPAALIHFTVAPAIAAQRAVPAYDLAFYLGLIGGLAPPLMAAWYAATYYHKTACPNGHPPYSSHLDRCPRCTLQDMSTAHGQSPATFPVDDPNIHLGPRRRRMKQAGGWLVSAQGRRYPLYQGENLLGRGPDMLFQFVGDQAVSRHHARITERDGQFFVMDCGSTYGTRLNDRSLTPYVEEALRGGDVIGLTEFTHVTFVVRG